MICVFVPNTFAPDLSIIDWLNQNIGEHPIEWIWWDSSYHGYNIGFIKDEDAVAFKLRFGL